VGVVELAGEGDGVMRPVGGIDTDDDGGHTGTVRPPAGPFIGVSGDVSAGFPQCRTVLATDAGRPRRA
jgi:hypothetical protein